MQIIKKNGRIEEFNISKIKRSILNASSETSQSLSDADLNIVEKEVFKVLTQLKREKTSSYEVFGIVLNILNNLNFNAVGKAYFKGSIEF